jgi:hypothetical protein
MIWEMQVKTTSYYFTPVRMVLAKDKRLIRVMSFAKDMEKRECISA